MQYDIKVLTSKSKDVTVKVGETVRIFDQSGAFDPNEQTKVDSTKAIVDVTSMTINELTANLNEMIKLEEDNGK